MGFVNGQDNNSLLSKRLKKVTSEYQPVVKKQEQSNSVVAKIERVLFAYRETLAYYQDILEQFEVQFLSNDADDASDQALNTTDYEFEKLSEQLKSCINELNDKIKTFEETGAKQLTAYKEAGENQLNRIDDLVQQLKNIPVQQVNQPVGIAEATPESMPTTMNPVPADEEYAVTNDNSDGMIFIDESLNVRTPENNQSVAPKSMESNMKLEDVLTGIEELKSSISSISEEVSQMTVTLSESDQESEEAQDEEDYLVQLEAYNKNLTDIKKRLDELMRFVGKVDGSIIESLKSHTNENRDAIISQLNEIKAMTENRNHGVKPLLVFNLIFGILNVGGIAFLILEYLGIINL